MDVRSNEPVQVEEDGNTNGSLSDTADKVYIPVLDDRGTMVGVIDGKTKLLIERLYYNSTGLIKSYSTTPNQGDISSETENLDDEGLNIGRSKFISFGWTGMYHEPVTNLYHTLYREYDAVHERWLSEDPVGYADGLNLYGAYMGVNGVDALGLEDAATCRRYIDEAKETFGRVQHRYNLTKSGLAGANSAAYLKETLRLYDKYQSQKKAAFCQIDAYTHNAFSLNWSPYNYYEEAFKLGDVLGLGSGSRGARYQDVDFIHENIDERITAFNSYSWSGEVLGEAGNYLLMATGVGGAASFIWKSASIIGLKETGKIIGREIWRNKGKIATFFATYEGSVRIGEHLVDQPYKSSVRKVGNILFAAFGINGVQNYIANRLSRVIVIGQSMFRIEKAAKFLREYGANAKWYQAWTKYYPKNRPLTPSELSNNLDRNAKWIQKKIDEDYLIFDIGLDPVRSKKSSKVKIE